jgi:glycosyltransferase
MEKPNLMWRRQAMSMSQRPFFISIITVSKNCYADAVRSANSLVPQLTTDIQWIVIDSASTDGTSEMWQATFETGAVNTLIVEPDAGVYDALNKALLHATGHFVAILHCGDVMLPGAIDAISCSLRASSVNKQSAALHVFSCRFSAHGRVISHWTPSTSILPTLRSGRTIPHAAAVITRSELLQAGGYNCDFNFAADYKLISDLCVKGVNIAIYSEPIVEIDTGGLSMQYRHLSRICKEIEEIRRVTWKASHPLALPIRFVKTTLSLFLRDIASCLFQAKAYIRDAAK